MDHWQGSKLGQTGSPSHKHDCFLTNIIYFFLTLASSLASLKPLSTISEGKRSRTRMYGGFSWACLLSCNSSDCTHNRGRRLYTVEGSQLIHCFTDLFCSVSLCLQAWPWETSLSSQPPAVLLAGDLQLHKELPRASTFSSVNWQEDCILEVHYQDQASVSPHGNMQGSDVQ